MNNKSDREIFLEYLDKEKIDLNKKYDKEKNKKIKRNFSKIKHIDLHGKTSSEAEYTVRALLKSEKYTETEKIIFICGKGIHSKDGPVLQNTVKEILNKMKEYYDDYSMDINGNIHVMLR